MIRFPCRCNYVLEVPADQAGLTVQCPQCGRLNDVPTLGDLPNLDKQGNYKVQELRLREEPNRLADLHEAFSRELHGLDVDLRGPVGEMPPPEADYPMATAPAPGGSTPGGPGLDSGSEEIPLAEPEQPTPTARPRYDPETGELIVPVELQAMPPEPPPLPLPLAMASNRTAEAVANSPQGLGVLVAMFRPLNLLVIGMYALAISGMIVTLMVPGCARIFIMGSATLWLLILVFSHLGNIIEDTGPMERDEVPRLMRDVNLLEDYFYPFCRVLGALLVAYAPYILWQAWLVATYLMPQLPTPSAEPLFDAIDWGLQGLGVLFFPATLLTLCTSGGILNLRPDRLIGVMWRGGPFHYAVAVALWIGIAYLLDMLRPLLAFLAASYISLALGVILVVAPVIYSFLIHGLGWLLGSIYRRHHDDFPWAYQRYERSQRGDAAAKPAPPARPTGFPVQPVKPANPQPRQPHTPSHGPGDIR